MILVFFVSIVNINSTERLAMYIACAIIKF